MNELRREVAILYVMVAFTAAVNAALAIAHAGKIDAIEARLDALESAAEGTDP